ncbi:hypothetical protein EJ110_NYTH47773 [Nymphaea thermarum]|nr:hypothetical protein EJ110_NYTH47773 [Nymphaea thermarum]
MAASSLLLFSLCIGLQIFSGFADKLFLNIDCGAMGTRNDRQGMKWVGDGSYIIAGREGNTWFKASFFYGNYDGKSSPPSFDLQFDGNHWATVTTASCQGQYFEVIYAPKRENISVCVARTSPDQVPFISALEIREFEPGMYETNGAEDFLLTWRRKAFGSKVFVR